MKILKSLVGMGVLLLALGTGSPALATDVDPEDGLVCHSKFNALRTQIGLAMTALEVNAKHASRDERNMLLKEEDARSKYDDGKLFDSEHKIGNIWTKAKSLRDGETAKKVKIGDLGDNTEGLIKALNDVLSCIPAPGGFDTVADIP